MTLQDLEDFTPDSSSEVSEDEIGDIIQNYANEIDIPNIHINNPTLSKMYRELFLFNYPKYLETYNTEDVILSLREIKDYIKVNPEFKRIFDQKQEGKELVNLIAKKEIKTLQDAIDYIQNKDSSVEYPHGDFLVDSNVEIDIKRFKSEKDTSFRGFPHYVMVVSLTEDAFKEFIKEVDFNYSEVSSPAGTLKDFLYYYKDKPHSHQIVTMPDKFCLGWVRFTVYTDEEDNKKIIIDELQSDLTPDDMNVAFEKYKTSLPATLYRDAFVDQETLYQFILNSFIKKMREEYNYSKIYSVDYDKKSANSKMDVDYAKYKNIPSQELEYIKNMKAPKFPYHDILKKKFGFSKTKSDMEGFLLLEKKKVKESINDKNLFKALFVLGGAGSGKSKVATSLVGFDEFGISSSLGVKLLDSDLFYERITKLRGLDMSSSEDKSTLDKQQDIFSRSRELNDIKKNFLLNGMLPVIFTSTGRNSESTLNLAKEIKSYGYDVRCIYIDVPLEISLKRNKSRDRVLNDDIVTQTWRDSQKNKQIYRDYFAKNYIEIQNVDKTPKELSKFEEVLYQQGKSFFESPLQNRIGVKILNLMRNKGYKYLSDIPEEEWTLLHY